MNRKRWGRIAVLCGLLTAGCQSNDGDPNRDAGAVDAGNASGGNASGGGETAGCELIDCQPGNACIEDEQGNGSCVPDACATVRCRAGTHCELKQVQCFAPPCKPTAECVADEECTGPIIDCAAPPDGCNYMGGGCVNGNWTCGRLVCDGSGI